MLDKGVGKDAPKRIVELGAGDGNFMLGIAKRFARKWPGVELVLLDAKDAVSDETRRDFEGLGWRVEIVAGDVFDFLKKPSSKPADVMVANLFLHQFSDAQLQLLLSLAAKRTRLFAACEPRRAFVPLVFSRLVGLIGCNEVTRNDARLSVKAGFLDRELSALWPTHERWVVRERSAKLFTHAFMAERIAKS